MANNLFISYDLRGDNRLYQAVFEAINRLGQAKHLELSQFYVDSLYTAHQAAGQVWAVMQPHDRLLVIDSTNNAAMWYGISDENEAFIKSHWNL